ncbi:MAG: carboxypeptidase regulatory-like domain-containing protein [Planctomycetaceae bacterium]|nr:carboxypeptidase regulatory-like domain-containing protein [Planctomycetaceae bacterium]
MMRLPHWQGAAVVLACWGLLLPQQTVQADGTSAKSQAPQLQAADVALSDTGALRGSVFMPNGKHVDGATVAILQGENVVARTTTDAQGAFEIQQMKPGSYQVVVAKHGAPVRAWSADAAPPSAHQRAVLVVGKPVARAQGDAFGGFDVITLITLGTAITAATFAIINHGQIDDLEEKIDRLISP